MRCLRKFPYTLGAIGLVGSLAAYMLVLTAAPDTTSLDGYGKR